MASSIDVLKEAKAEGLSRIDEIADEESRRLGLTAEECRDYLANTIRYDLGEREIKSLRVFGEKALDHRLIENAAEIRMFGG